MTLSRSSIEPFLQFSARRDLREAAFRAWEARGENGGATDNRAIAAEMVRLRAERARLLGYESYAHYRLADTMAKTPGAALDLLESVWAPGVSSALKEQEALQAIIAGEGGNFKVAPWDWRYLAEKRRKAEFDFDEGELKPYLQLDRMIEAAFYAASRLFGLGFEERFDLKLYDPDVRAWAVSGRDGSPIALFIGDYFARPSKRSGAWMSNFRAQQKLDGLQLPIVVNVMNFAKGAEGEASLLSLADARTLFHEFGHALHGMLSDVTYPLISGTRVAGDFVEFPSQLYEQWIKEPEMLRRFALHYKTGEPMPEALSPSLRARAGSIRAGRRSNIRLPRWSTSSCTSIRRPRMSMSSPSSGRSWRGSACPTQSPCVIALPISSISSRAAIRPPITATYGRRFSTPTASRRSRRPATSSTPRLPIGCMTSSMRPAAAAIMMLPIEAFAAARPRRRRCSASEASRPAASEASAAQRAPLHFHQSPSSW